MLDKGCSCDWPKNPSPCPYCADVLVSGIPDGKGGRIWNDLWEPGVQRQRMRAIGEKAWAEFSPEFGKDPECYFCRTGLSATSCTAMPMPAKFCEAHSKHGARMMEFMFDSTFTGA